MDDFGLSARHRSFVDHYILTNNVLKSAIAAGYSPNTAQVNGSRVLSNDKVQKYYKYRISQITAKNDEKISFILSRLQEIASADIRDFVNPDGSLKPIDGKVNGRLIQSVKQTSHGTQVVLHSAEKALELMGRYLGMWSDKIDITSNGNDINPGVINITYQEIVKHDITGESMIEPGTTDIV